MRVTAVPMNKLICLTQHFAVTGALQEADFAQIAAPDSSRCCRTCRTGSRRPISAAGGGGACRARRAGLSPRADHQGRLFTDRVVDGVGAALRELPGPVLAHCASGLRSAVAWGAAASRVQPADAVLARLQAAGFNLDAVRDELESLRDPSHSGAIPPALDACGGV